MSQFPEPIAIIRVLQRYLINTVSKISPLCHLQVDLEAGSPQMALSLHTPSQHGLPMRVLRRCQYAIIIFAGDPE